MNKVVYSDKYQLIIKPTQSGKTFIVLSEIKKLFVENKDDPDQRIVNILFCDIVFNIIIIHILCYWCLFR
jgi:predicted AAA+ superfamily ATPase